VRGLKGKNVLVTGGSSGIGQAIAVRFAEYGANVAINYLRAPEEAAGTEEQVRACVRRVRQEGVRDVLVGGDVSQEGDVVRLVEQAAGELGGLDVLVNNAGIQISRPSEELSGADFDEVLAVNLRGAFLCAREAIRRFLVAAGGGVIVNVSSVHQRIPKPGYLGYSVSKGGMQNLTTTLALEYAGRGIRVNGIGPGRHRHADQPRVGRRPRQAGAGRGAHPHPAGRYRRRDGRGDLLPGQRRRGRRHRPDPVRRRRPHPLPQLPRALVVRVTEAIAR
jgi:glucose 1-dehydrogenase